MPLNDWYAALRWWLALMVIGAACTPLCLIILRRLPDRGYAFVKMAGLLLISYLFWMLGSLGFLANDLGGVLFCLVLVAAASWWVTRRSRTEIGAWLRTNRRQILITELLFALVFFFWAWVRAQNPAITGTEKPMEFAFLNAVGRSAQMPPLDPWLSGYAISYYYFGYVMTSLIGQLAFVAEPLGFNLGIAWLAAGTATGAFGLVYNLVASDRVTRHAVGVQRRAITLGIVAALAIPLAGNMQILLELLHANGAGSPQFWSWLDVRDINGPAEDGGFDSDGPRFWWWWRSSRVIHEYHLSGRPEEGLEPIVEFPGFSFILGDMHPHVLALPFAFLSLALALAWWLRTPPATAAGDEEEEDPSWLQRAGFILGRVGLPLYAATVLVLGGLSFLNTWDVLIHLFIVVSAYVLSRWRANGAWRNSFVGDALLLAFMLVIPAFLLYLPFYLGFRSQAGPPFLLPMLMRPTRLAHYLIIFAMPLAAIIPFLIALLARRRRLPWRAAIGAPVALIIGLTILMFLLGLIIAPTAEGGTRLATLAAELGVQIPDFPAGTLGARFSWAMRAVAGLAIPILTARLAAPWLILFLALLTGAVVAALVSLLEHGDEKGVDAGQPPAAFSTVPFVLLLIFAGALLTLGPEFVYLRDNFGQRLNTVFKFYYQAWIFFGVAALAGLDYLWRTQRSLAWLASAVYGAMLAVALLFPAFGISSRAQEYAAPSTLDGLAHYEVGQPAEAAALRWLRENVEGTPVIVEAVGGQYSPQGHGRVSASTGLPTLVGWAGHEYQWRGSTPVPAEREQAAAMIYGSASWPETAALLDQHNVSLVYVGPLEVSTYGPAVHDKFRDTLEVAYANDSVIIYRWQPN